MQCDGGDKGARGGGGAFWDGVQWQDSGAHAGIRESIPGVGADPVRHRLVS